AVAASETRPNAIDVGLKQACQTGVLGPLTATRPEAIAPRAAAKKKGARTDEMPNTTPVLRRPLGPVQTWRKAKKAPRRTRASRRPNAVELARTAVTATTSQNRRPRVRASGRMEHPPREPAPVDARPRGASA